jgi:hypothetical protein
MRPNKIVCLAAGTAVVLAGCSVVGTTSTGTSALVVRIGLYGGPMTPNGHMGLDGAPAPDEPVSVSGPDGHIWSARTGSDGAATFQLPRGRYRVTSSFCGLSAKVSVGRARVGDHGPDLPRPLTRHGAARRPQTRGSAPPARYGPASEN